MSKKGVIVIEDDKKTVWFLRFFIHRKTYRNQGFVYLQGDKPVHCSSEGKWLEELNIVTTSQKRADELSWKFFHEKYPEYGECIQLF